MNKKIVKSIAILAVLAAFAACGQKEVVTGKEVAVKEASMDTGVKLVPEKAVSFTILHLNDTHGRVKPGKYDGMGYARVQTLANLERENNENTILLDAGDTIHGTVFAALSKGESVVNIMNKMNYVAMAPGNHDFNYGLDRLQELEDQMNFSLITSNVEYKDSGEDAFKPYVIKELPNGVKVGIFGLSTPETAYKTNPTNVEAVNFSSPVEAAKESVAALKAEGVHYIVALSHLGLDEATYYTSIKVANEVNDIDLIVDGHSHTTLDKGKLVGDTLIVQAGFYDQNLGKVEITIDENGISTENAGLITKTYAMENVEEDAEINSIIAEVDAANEVITSVVVGESNTYLNGAREYVRAGETNLGNMITEAMLAKSGADVALTNGGGIRSSIEEGTITRGDLVSVLPFGNYVVVLEVTGQDIKDALENGVQFYPAPEGLFPHVAGLRFEFNPANEVGNKVTKVTLANGEALDLAKTYTLATNDFMAAGGDDYGMLKGKKTINEYESLEELLGQYIQENGITHSDVDGRITVVK